VHAGSIVVNIATYLLQNNELFAVSSQDDDFLLSDIGHFHLILNCNSNTRMNFILSLLFISIKDL